MGKLEELAEEARLRADLSGENDADLSGNARVVHLAGLPALDYDSRRKEEARRLGVRTATLDKLVNELRAAKIQPGEDAAWLDNLILGDRGPLDHVANVVIVLEADPTFNAAIRFDELRNTVVVGTLPWHACTNWRDWTDRDDIAMARWCALRGLPIRPGTVADGVLDFAKSHSFNPLRDRLGTLSWDGAPRLDSWLAAYLGTEDNAYTSAVGRAWLISAVARIYRPGCKADHALILEGPQGVFKSTACAILALSPEWFTDETAELGSKDSAQDLRGKWIVELGELSSMTRASVEKAKAFISRSVDHYRPSYGRRSQDFPRHCVFVGSTNDDTYLADETGNRRFWPVKVGAIDTGALRRDVEQIWAEAVAAFQAGEPWHLSRELEAHAREQQAERQRRDPWEVAVMEWAERQTGPVTIADALRFAVQRNLDQCDRHHETRVGTIFKANGWTGHRPRVGGGRIRVYQRPEPAEGRTGPTFTEGGWTKKPSNHGAGPTGPTGPTDSYIHVGTNVPPTPTQADSDSPHESKGITRSSRTGWTTRGNAGFFGPTISKQVGPEGTGVGPTPSAWQDLDHWRSRLRQAGPPADRRTVIEAWAGAAGATITELDDGPPRVTLPSDLPPCLALAELRQHVRWANGEGGR